MGSNRHEWTVEDHLRAKPESLRELFERLDQVIRGCGPSERRVTKTAITYRGAVRGFAGVTPRRRHLVGFLDLTEALDEEPFTRATPYTKRLWVNRFAIDDVDQLDRAFAARVAQAYAVGLGAHHH